MRFYDLVVEKAFSRLGENQIKQNSRKIAYLQEMVLGKLNTHPHAKEWNWTLIPYTKIY